MDLKDVTHWITRGALNIREGCTTIEAGSPVHQAMVEWSRLAAAGELPASSPPALLAAALDLLAACERIHASYGECSQEDEADQVVRLQVSMATMHKVVAAIAKAKPPTPEVR